MNPHIQALRALAAVTFQRIFQIIAWVFLLGFALVVALLAVLMQQASAWWGLFFVPLVPVGLLILGVGCLVWMLSKKLLPRHLTRSERRQVIAVSQRLVATSERVRTPPFVLGAMIAVDIIRRRPTRTVEKFTTDGEALRSELNQLAAMFEDSSR